MIRLIHTSDLHLDMCFSGSGMPASFGNRRRQSLRDCFHAIVERAGDWPADALLIAGDLFEHDRVSRDTARFLIKEFESIPNVSVFISPGNHDPYTHDSIYATENWPENVCIFDEPNWSSLAVSDGALTVHGFGFDSPHMVGNPFGDLIVPEVGPQTVHVAVGHGSERSHQPPDKDAYAAFDASDATPEGLTYLALGHFHSVTQIEGKFDTTVYYSGSPEGHNLREGGMCHYLEVEIDEGAVSVARVPSSGTLYSTYRVACDRFQSSQDMIMAIRDISRQESLRQIARIIFTGSMDPAIQAEMGLVYDAAAMDFEKLYIVDQTDPVDDYEQLAREDTSLGAFVRRLNEQIDAATDDVLHQRLERTRYLGVSAFSARDIEIRGLERG